MDRADDYAAFRPSYPPEIIDAVLAGYAHPRVADIGAGTGISSRLLANAGAQVIAIEPNASMRNALVQTPHITPVDGTSEATGLADACVDIVVAFQSYHWFTVEPTLNEWRRIVEPQGRFGAVWNRRDSNDSFTHAFDERIAEFGERVREIDRLRRDATVASDFVRAGCEHFKVVECTHRQSLDWEALLGFARSCSYLPRSGAEYDRLVASLKELVDLPGFREGYAFTWTCTAYLGTFDPS